MGSVKFDLKLVHFMHYRVGINAIIYYRYSRSHYAENWSIHMICNGIIQQKHAKLAFYIVQWNANIVILQLFNE